jgi:hypothetical protein
MRDERGARPGVERGSRGVGLWRPGDGQGALTGGESRLRRGRAASRLAVHRALTRLSESAGPPLRPPGAHGPRMRSGAGAREPPARSESALGPQEAGGGPLAGGESAGVTRMSQARLRRRSAAAFLGPATRRPRSLTCSSPSPPPPSPHEVLGPPPPPPGNPPPLPPSFGGLNEAPGLG